MTTTGEMTLEDAAREAAGNWKQFQCFCWDRRDDLDDPHHWAIIWRTSRTTACRSDTCGKSVRQGNPVESW